MTYLTLPTDTQRRLTFYLAMEEWAAREAPPSPSLEGGKPPSDSPLKGENNNKSPFKGDLEGRFKGDLEGRFKGDLEGSFFFLWQVAPTVIFGRHQDIEREVNISYCREHGIEYYRRKSGGGCVYADKGNLMISIITASDQVQQTFRAYMQLLAGLLKELGIEATTTENNDVLVGGRKVSGNAYWHQPGRSILHGTMLFDTDLRNMTHAITPPTTKLRKHGVESVRQRITLLREHTSLTMDEFRQHVRRKLCSSEYVLTDKDIKQVETIEQTYLNTEFIYGKENMSL